ncbi:MAG: hypothetical protein QG635_1685, partial [Bacteroidota bacterium]|nr:hypothetical protein [Bacteroidota bacterium]
SNLPENGSTYTIAEDFVNPNLLFVGTEFGLFFTIDGGNKWVQLKGDFPIIAVRDLEIQKRENDLVVGTFGRSIYILDDYTPLRELKPEILEKEFNIFPIKDALMFLEDGSKEKSGLGETFYRGKNPPFGAIFTYYLKEAYKTKKDLRKEAESKAEKEGKDIIYPTFEQLRAEDEEEAPVLIFTITDAAGKIVRKLTESPKPGINRIAWDLREPDSSPINKNTDINKYSGLPVPPGKYMVSVEKKVDGNTTRIAEPIEFTTKILNNKTLPAKNPVEQQEFYKKLTKLNQAITGTNKALEEVKNRIDLIQKTLLATSGASPDLLKKSKEYEIRANEINIKLNGDESIAKRNANQPPSINDRFNAIAYSVYWATSDITQTAKDSYRIVSEEFKPLLENLRQLSEVDLKSLEKEMEKLDAPWTPGRIPEWNPE